MSALLLSLAGILESLCDTILAESCTSVKPCSFTWAITDGFPAPIES
jgi:hypothetical protein